MRKLSPSAQSVSISRQLGIASNSAAESKVGDRIRVFILGGLYYLVDDMDDLVTWEIELHLSFQPLTHHIHF